MKIKIIYVLFLGLLSISTLQAQKERDNFEIQVDGLGCPFCAYGLEKKFKEFKGIKNVKINIKTGDFTFTYPTEKKLTLSQVEKQVKKAGYTPITLRVTRSSGGIETVNYKNGE